MYRRVIPRDLFNESKLLKCLGQLVLIIHDGRDKNDNHLKLKYDFDGDRFVIDQNKADGSLFCTTVQFRAGDAHLNLYSAYNCKGAFPLLCMTDKCEEIEVFHDDGTLTDEFLAYVEDLHRRMS